MKPIFYLAVAFSLSLPCALADPFTEYIEYRFRPNLGSIKIEQGKVRGKQYRDYLTNNDNIRQLALKDIFSCGDSIAHDYKRTAKLGKYTIVTTMTISPAAGHGYGGAVPKEHILILVNNRKKIDCSFGYAPWLDNITVSSISLYPEDGIIEINASDMRGKKILGSKFWQAATFLEERTIITNEVLLKSTKSESE